MFYICMGALRSLFIAWCAWLTLGHTSAVLADSIGQGSDHVDTVSTNSRLSLHAVLQQVVAIHPQQSLLTAHQQMVQARRTMANSWLPQAPSVGFSHQNDALLSNRDEREWQAQVQIPIWLPGQRQARNQVGSTGTTGSEDHTSISGSAGIPLCGMYSALFMTDQDML